MDKGFADSIKIVAGSNLIGELLHTEKRKYRVKIGDHHTKLFLQSPAIVGQYLRKVTALVML